MPPILKSVLAVLGGVVAGFIVIFVVQNISSAMYSLPEDVGTADREALARAMAGLPLGAFLMVLLSYALGSLLGGWVAARNAPRAPMAHALAVGALLTLAGLMNLMAFRHPTWFIVLNVPEFVFFAWLGGLAGRPLLRPGPSAAA
ncbi:MAG TPA: hypothetical protein VLE53_15980 [Gemmatimonadaceae bacterium]|nr:hypothetical protein [Gemmatimonadaceae bacterium]